MIEKIETYKDGAVVNDQKKWGDIRFGTEFNMAYSGCEIFATYNAQIKLGEKLTGKDLISMISEFEADGAVLEGGWGVAPTAIQDYLAEKYKNDKSISISMYIPEKKGASNNVINKIGKNNDVFIATVYNNKDKITD